MKKSAENSAGEQRLVRDVAELRGMAGRDRQRQRGGGAVTVRKVVVERSSERERARRERLRLNGDRGEDFGTVAFD